MIRTSLWKEKGTILQEFCATTGYSPPYAASLLRDRGRWTWCAMTEGRQLGSRIQNREHAPMTPLHRLLAAPEVSDQAKARLLRQLRDIDPLSLQRDIHILEARILRKTSQDTFLGAVTSKTSSL